MFLRLLGAVGVGDDVGSVVGVGGRTPEAVLANLALAQGRLVPVDTLIAAVWDEPIASARNAVQVAVSGLRRRLGAQSIDGGRDGYRLPTGLLRIDLIEAEDLATDAQRAFDGGRPSAAVASCAAVAELFAGEPLSGLTSVWSAGHRERAQELRRSVATMHARALVELHRFRQAIDLLRKEISDRPFDEALHELLMRALALDGKPSDALDLYEALRRRLADELGTDPAPTTAHTFTEILAGRLIPVTPTPRREEPILAMPATGSPLLGREDEIHDATARLGRGQRLVSILGAGGIGKTRLALEVASRVSTENATPSVFVDLAAARESGEVRSAVAGVLNVGVESIADSLSGTDTLLILDNAEHVLDEVAGLVIDLLAVPSVRVLVTTRTPLHLRDESILDLDGLDTHGPNSPALQLLAERSRLTADELAASSAHLQTLAERTDGVPLMLELLATSLQWRTPIEVVGELDGILCAASDTSRDRPSRHASVTAVVEWSVLRASSDARTALGAMGVIRGAFSDAAASAVILAAVPAREWRELLAELLDLSLVKRVRQPGQVRFRLLEPVRLYLIGSEFVPQPTNSVFRAHAMHYLGTLLDHHHREVDEPDSFLNYVRREDANLTPATWWALEHDPQSAVDHLGAIAWGWYERGRHDDVHSIDDATRDRRLGTPVQQAAFTISALNSAGDLADRSDTDWAPRLAALTGLAAQLDDAWHRRYVAGVVQMARVEGDLPKALAMTECFRPNTGRARQVRYSMRAIVLVAMGDFAGAFVEMRAATDDLEGAGRSSRVFALSNLGYGLMVHGEHEEAREVLEQALYLASEGGNALELASIEMNLAWVDLKSGRPDDALGWVRRTIVGQRGHVDWTAFTEALLISAIAFLDLGRLVDARLLAGTAVPRVLQHPELVDTFITEQATLLVSATAIPSDEKPRRELEDHDLLGLIDRR